MLNKEKLERGNKNHTSHIAPHTSQKGITLIALIITIIVMLILVGVTINVVLTGGLFDKAEAAKKGTEMATEKEQLLNAILGTLDDNGKFNLDQIILPSGFRQVSEDSSKVIYEGPSTNQYKVDKGNGKIEEVPENENITPTPPSGESEILGLYGNKESFAIELLENGKAIIYDNVGLIDEYADDIVVVEGEYDNTSITFTNIDENGQETTMKINYIYNAIKDEETNEIVNKTLCGIVEDGSEGFDVPVLLTTNNIQGFNTNLYDNKYFKAQNGGELFFYEGYYNTYVACSERSYYFVHQGCIWEYYEDEVDSAYAASFKINSDGTLTELGEADPSSGIGIYSEVK